ncbi:hypothetical protein VDGL01_09516 [Verticillium dahliae]
MESQTEAQETVERGVRQLSYRPEWKRLVLTVQPDSPAVRNLRRTIKYLSVPPYPRLWPRLWQKTCRRPPPPTSSRLQRMQPLSSKSPAPSSLDHPSRVGIYDDRHGALLEAFST